MCKIYLGLNLDINNQALGSLASLASLFMALRADEELGLLITLEEKLHLKFMNIQYLLSHKVESFSLFTIDKTLLLILNAGCFQARDLRVISCTSSGSARNRSTVTRTIQSIRERLGLLG